MIVETQIEQGKKKKKVDNKLHNRNHNVIKTLHLSININPKSEHIAKTQIMNTKLVPLTSYTSPNPYTTTCSSSVTKLTLKPRTRPLPAMPWQQPNQYKPSFTNTSLSNSLASVTHLATNNWYVFHNTLQQPIATRESKPIHNHNRFRVPQHLPTIVT